MEKNDRVCNLSGPKNSYQCFPSICTSGQIERRNKKMHVLRFAAYASELCFQTTYEHQYNQNGLQNNQKGPNYEKQNVSRKFPKKSPTNNPKTIKTNLNQKTIKRSNNNQKQS